MKSPAPDYFDAVVPRLVSGSKVLPFLRFLRLHDKLKEFRSLVRSKADPVKRLSVFLELLQISGVPITFDGLVDGLPEVVAANRYPPQLPWQIPSPASTKRQQEDIVLEDSLSYEGRAVAEVVAMLASTYGWTADYILTQLTYYEVSVYMQEALVIEHDQLKWQYLFSEVGAKKVGNEYVKQDFPDPYWMRKTPVRRSVPKPLPARFRPTGYVIDYTKSREGEAYEVPKE